MLLVLEGLDEGGRGGFGFGADHRQRLGGANVWPLVLEGLDEGGHGGFTDLHQRLSGVRANGRLLVLEGLGEGRHGGLGPGAELHQRPGGVRAND